MPYVLNRELTIGSYINNVTHETFKEILVYHFKYGLYMEEQY